MARVQLAAQLAAAAAGPEEEEEEDEGYCTPEDFIEPERESTGKGFYLDAAYERKVKQQTYAIKKVLPRWIAQEVGRPFNTRDADRLLGYYREAQRQYGSKIINNFDFDCFIRLEAEQHVRWQGTPNDALNMLSTKEMNDEVKAQIIAALDKPKRRR
jgi:hypothetical protein